MKTWIVAAMAAGCAMSGRPTAKLARCPEPVPDVPRLDSYAALEVPATRWVEMVFDQGEWRPSARIAMPHHHATRLELTNVDDFPVLADHQGERVRFTIEVMSRSIHQVAGRREWRATYRARIVAACIPDQG